jgi:hypothetical protein
MDTLYNLVYFNNQLSLDVWVVVILDNVRQTLQPRIHLDLNLDFCADCQVDHLLAF